MRAVYTKLWREAWKQRGQMLSIGAVVAVGVMTVLTMRGTYESLVISQNLYYQEARFPDVWAHLERAPQSSHSRIEAITGVQVADTRISHMARLDIPGHDAPALGQFVSLPEHHRPRISDLHIKTGRYIDSGSRNEVIISENFALANSLTPGDTLRAVINGRYRDFDIVGTAISPEYTYAVAPGTLYPDDERYGIVWIGRPALGPATDLDGAFNEVVLTYSPGADRNRVLAELDEILVPYGGLGAFERKDQASHAILASELESNRTMGTAIPAVFLLVAAFLLNIVLGRMIATQRTEIAVLKAFGYRNAEVGTHYFLFAMLAVIGGAAVGIGLGIWAGASMMQLYGDYFDFPTLRYQVQPGLVAIAVAVSVVAAAVGALGSVRRAVSLPPAEAMRPEPPAEFTSGFMERLGLGNVLSAAGRIVLRNIERSPMRSVISSIGVAFSVAILIIGLFMFDGVGYMMDLQFRIAQREDLTVVFNRPTPFSVQHELLRIDGVTRVELFRTVPVRLHNGHRKRETAITGLESRGELRQIVTVNGGTQPVPAHGLVMSSFLADHLGLEIGDAVTIEVLEGQRRVTVAPVVGIVDDFVGVSAYMSMDALHAIAKGGQSVSGAFLLVSDERMRETNAHLKILPSVASVASPAQLLASFEAQLAESLYIGVFVILFFSGVISVAIIYNGARISLSERGRELASLRVLGFTRGEVALILFGEQGVVTILGIPLGWVLGYGLAAAVSTGMQSETYRIPLIIHSATFFWAAVITIAAAVGSGLLVRRRLDRMDLIEVLKTRE